MVHRRPLPTKGERMTRRIVYIATTTAPLYLDEIPHVYTTALCSDGTVWQHVEGESRWKQLPKVPPAPDDDFLDEDFADFDDFQAVPL